VPPAELGQCYQWIETLSDTDRQLALNFVAYFVDLAVYGVLTNIDGVSGNLVHGGFADLLNVAVSIVHRNEQGHPDRNAVDENIDLYEERTFLYERWPDWLEQYSRTKDRVRVVDGE